MMTTPSRILFAFAFVPFLAGCNEGASVGGNDADPHAQDSYAVRGAVTFEDKPVDGEATFTPVGGGEAIKVPVKNGSYELDAPKGKYKVALTGKAGDADLPEGLSVERAVGGDTVGQTVNITLPETDAEGHEGSTPDEVRDLDPSGTPAKEGA